MFSHTGCIDSYLCPVAVRVKFDSSKRDTYVLSTMNTRKAAIAFFSLMMIGFLAAPVLADSHIVDLTDDTSEVKEVEVRSRGLAYDVEEIRVNLGDTVRVTYINGGGRHDWVLDEFEGAQTSIIAGGRQETIEFVADQAGTFEFYCSVPGHRAAGMVGRFVVVD